VETMDWFAVMVTFVKRLGFGENVKVPISIK
jgi:hypothetical protein